MIRRGDYDDVFNLLMSLWSLSARGGIQRTVRLGQDEGSLETGLQLLHERQVTAQSLDAFNHSYKCYRCEQ